VVWDLALGAASTPPAMAGGRVFVAAGETDGDAVFVAFDAATSRPLYGGDFPAPWDQSAAPVVAGDTVYLLDRVGTVTAADVASGEPRWRTRTHTSVLYGRMVVNARTVIFQTFDDHVVALDRATGDVVLGTSERAFPIDVEATDDTLVVALRRGAPSRIEARAAPGTGNSHARTSEFARPSSARRRRPRAFAGGGPNQRNGAVAWLS
jgi:outer membrane protein assembly factor BamB